MPSAPRCVALVGPYLSGKTSLLEAMLFASGTTGRHGSVRDGNSVGDHSAEARARQMSTEINVANATFLEDPWTILDCPGNVELLYEAQQAMLVADVVVVVCEPEVERAVTVSALLRFLSRHQIPHMLYINKLDTASARVRDVLAALQAYSDQPLVLRQVRQPLGAGVGDETLVEQAVPLLREVHTGRSGERHDGDLQHLLDVPQHRRLETGVLRHSLDDEGGAGGQAGDPREHGQPGRGRRARCR